MHKFIRHIVFVLILTGLTSAPFMAERAFAYLDNSGELCINVKQELARGKEYASFIGTADMQAGNLLITSSEQDYSEMKDAATGQLFLRYGFNRIIKRNILDYAKSEKSFSRSLSRAGRYIDIMSAVFIEKGMPAELAFLPLIESGFRSEAHSNMNASGMWQFMPATARSFGLKIDPWVDERRDPIKATHAAAAYLEDLYERFDDWNLALAAYNAGEGKIGNAIKRYKTDDYWKIRRTSYITRETKNYIPSFVAATAIAIYPEKYGFTEIEQLTPFRYDEVVIKNPMDLETVAEFTGVSLAAIKELNPELKHWCTPLNVSSYILRIPEGAKEAFLARLTEASEEELFYVQVYRVQEGDTVGKIAQMLNSSIQAIIEMNSLGREAMIIAGKDILVPMSRGQYIEGDEIVFYKPVIKSSSL
jgi:membrane-bound lytic murein transglycosylase D